MRTLALLLLTAAAPAFSAPPGWSGCKWDDPDYNTPKYRVGRILFRYEHTPEGLELALPAIQQYYPGTSILPGKGDVIYIPCVGAVDVIVAAGEGNKGKKGGKAWWWGADEDSEECDQCTPNICDDPSVKSEKAKKCEEEEAKNREFGPEVGTAGTVQERRGDRAALSDCSAFRRAAALINGAARMYDTGRLHARLLSGAVTDAVAMAQLSRGMLKEPPPPPPGRRPVDCTGVQNAAKALDSAYSDEVTALGNAAVPCGRAPTSDEDAEVCLGAAREALDMDKRIQRDQLANFLAAANAAPDCVDMTDEAKDKIELMLKQPCERNPMRCLTTAPATLRSAREALSKVKDPGLVSPGERVRAALAGPPEELAVETRLSMVAQHGDMDNVVLFKASTALRQASLFMDDTFAKVCERR